MLLAIPQGYTSISFFEQKYASEMCLYTGQGKNKHEWREFMLAACSPMLPTLHISPLQTPVTTKECKKRQREYKGQLVGIGKALGTRQTEK